MALPLEADVGITEYVSTVPGFKSILKHRFRDFQVHEVDPKGQVAHLTSLEPESQATPGSSAPAAATATATPNPCQARISIQDQKHNQDEFAPEQLAAARPQLVASFAALAGPENGTLLDGLLRRIIMMYGSEVDEGEEGQRQAESSAGGGTVTVTEKEEEQEEEEPNGGAVKAGGNGTSVAPTDTTGTIATVNASSTANQPRGRVGDVCMDISDGPLEAGEEEGKGKKNEVHQQEASEAEATAAAALTATPTVAAATVKATADPEAVADLAAAAQEPSVSVPTKAEAASGTSAVAVTAAVATAGATITAGATGTSEGRCALERTSVLLLPIASKEVRTAVHEFFRTTPGLPPMRTETVAAATTTTTEPQQQQQQQQRHEKSPSASDQQSPGSGSGGCGGGAGSKRGHPGGAEGSRPAKWQKGSWRGGRGRGSGDGGGGGGRGGGRGGSDRGRGGAPGGQQQQQHPRAAPALTRIEVIFDPRVFGKAGSGSGGRGGRDGGEGGWRGRGGRRGGRGGRGRGDWEGGQHDFVRFVLYKENMDTQVALSTVGRMLGITGGNCFGFAGTKDKRGVTCQFATAFKVAPTRLAHLNTRLRGIRLGTFFFSTDGLRLGCLAGNEFHLLMRDVRPAAPEAPALAVAVAATGTPPGGEADTEPATGAGVERFSGVDLMAQVTAACEAVARKGFINYFGLQRFGSGGAPTHEVGRALLRCEYENAVRLVLTGRSDERPDIAAARRLFFEQGDAKGALRGIPPYMLGERAVLGTLVRQGATAWSAAMLAVPRTLRMMYLHAWQSHVWNLATSHRIRTYGHDRVVAGDLVIPRGAGAPAAGGGGGVLLDGDVGDDAGEGAGDMLEDTSEAAARAAAAGVTTSAAKRLSLVRLVTDADVTAGRYSIFDVVLPLPGTEVEYPAHETGEWIRKAAAEAGVDLDQPAASSAVNFELSFASLTGDYRYLLHRPKDFTFAFKRYTDPNDDSLLLTDLELLQQQQQQPPGAGQAAGNQEAASEQQQQQQQDEKLSSSEGQHVAGGGEDQAQGAGSSLVSGSGPLLALELRFQLPGSCYATMLLRELTKASTSKAFHAGLSTAAVPAVRAAAEPQPPPLAECGDGNTDGAVTDLAPVGATVVSEDCEPSAADGSSRGAAMEVDAAGTST